MTCNKINKEDTCPERLYASCTYYELGLSEDSLITKDCPTIEDTTQDLYDLHDSVKDEIDVSSLGNSCITIVGDKTVKNFLIAIESKICEMGETIQSQADTIASMQTEITDLQNQNCP